MLQTQHIILRHCLDLNFRQLEDETALLAEVQSLAKNSVIPQMEAMFDEFCAKDMVIQIDKIELDLGTLDRRYWEIEFSSLLIRELQRHLKQLNFGLVTNNLPPKENEKVAEISALLNYLTLKQSIQEGYLYFLKTGHWPKMMPYIFLEEEYDHFIVQLLQESPDFGQQLLYLIRQNEQAATRLGFQAHAALLRALWISFQNALSESENATFKTLRDIFNAYLLHYHVTITNSKSVSSDGGVVEFMLEKHCPPEQSVEIFVDPNKLNKPKALAAWLVQISRHYKWDLANLAEVILVQSKVGNQINTSSIAFWAAVSESLYSGDSSKLSSSNGGRGKENNVPKSEAPSDVPKDQNILDASSNSSAYPSRQQSPGTQGLISEELSIINTPLETGQEKEYIVPIEPVSASTWQPELVPQVGNAESWHIKNAGLVILSPFLPSFFQKLGFLEGSAIRSIADSVRAVHLLNYLAEGKEQALEANLLFPKLLCGLPLGQPLPRFINLTKKEKTEAISLLKAVVRHWTALKSASEQALCESFLRRGGKLTQAENYYHLIVEISGLDILLQRLPWPISTVKLPWMPHHINVEWC